MLRWGVTATSTVIALAAVSAALAASPGPAANPSSLDLAQPPYLGVSCPGANSTACGRIGIAVWLKTRASGIEAELAGSTVRLNAPPLVRGRKYWQGFVHLNLKRLGLPDAWFGTEPYKVLNLRLTIHYGTRVARGMLRVTLQPGWG
jgi:hypothetical protein